MSPPVALVTGATEGIGRAIAFALGKAGYAVGVTARTGENVATLIEALSGEGIVTAGIAADVAEPEPVARLVDHVADRLGPVDLLVNNAGILIAKPLIECTLEEWDRMFAVNVRSLYLMTRAVLPAMQAKGSGDIINIASLAGKNGVANAAGYSASKHAVVGLSRSLMLELRRAGIRVVAICPGSVDTALLRGQSTFTPNRETILQPEDVAAAVVETVRLSRRAMVSELDLRPTNP
jgi:3-oxoacyl-[acyl-carrier protein] reductase